MAVHLRTITAKVPAEAAKSAVIRRAWLAGLMATARKVHRFIPSGLLDLNPLRQIEIEHRFCRILSNCVCVDSVSGATSNR